MKIFNPEHETKTHKKECFLHFDGVLVVVNKEGKKLITLLHISPKGKLVRHYTKCYKETNKLSDYEHNLKFDVEGRIELEESENEASEIL